MIKTSLSLPILNRFSTNPIEKKAAISFKAEAITDTFKKNKNNVEETSSVKPSLGESYIHYIVGIDRNKNVKKILDREPEIKKIAGDKFKRIQIEKDKYSPDDNFVVVAELEKKDRYKEYFDTNLDRTAEEKTYFQKNENTGEVFRIVKSRDVVNNTISKVRTKFIEGDLSKGILDKNTLIDEVKIYKDKDGKTIKKDYIYPSKLMGVYNQKTVYPNGTEKHLSQVKTFDKSDGIKVIQKDMTSPDGSKTNYRYEFDDKGNRLLEYKITDKNGKVLMDIDKTFEVVSDNKFVSSNGDKVYEITFEEDKLLVQEKGKEAKTIISFDEKINGTDTGKVIVKNILKKMSGEQLIALNNTVGAIRGTKNDAECRINLFDKQVVIANDLFAALHEIGHAKDFEKSKGRDFVQSYTSDENLQKIFKEENENFSKTFTNVQKEHISYFLTNDDYDKEAYLVGLSEIVADVNALNDVHSTNENLGARIHYLQQNFPKSIAYLNTKL